MASKTLDLDLIDLPKSVDKITLKKLIGVKHIISLEIK